MPLIDVDDETKRAMVVSVVTQYRILKFVAVNVSDTQLLRKPLKHLKLGTYKNLETATMETPVFEVIHQLVNNSISSVPILNSDGIVMNVFETVDVITLIKGGVYDDLNLNVGEALQKRSEVCTTLDVLFAQRVDCDLGLPGDLHLLYRRSPGHYFRHNTKVTGASAGSCRRRKSSGRNPYTE